MFPLKPTVWPGYSGDEKRLPFHIWLFYESQISLRTKSKVPVRKYLKIKGLLCKRDAEMKQK